MSAATTAAPTAARVATAPRRPATSWRLVAIAAPCVLALAALPGCVLFAATLLAPALLVRILETRPHPARPNASRPGGAPPQHGLALPVLLACLAAAIGPACALCSHGVPDVSDALDSLSHPAVLGAAWLAGGAAWLSVELAGPAICTGLLARDAHLLARLDAEIAAIDIEFQPSSQRDAASGPRPSGAGGTGSA